MPVEMKVVKRVVETTAVLVLIITAGETASKDVKITNQSLTLTNSTTTNFTNTNTATSTTTNTNLQTNEAEPISLEFKMPEKVDLKKFVLFEHYDEVKVKRDETNSVITVEFFGNVEIKFQNKTLKADRVVLSIRSNKLLEISGKGNVWLKEGNKFYTADSFYFLPNRELSIAYNVRTYMSPMYYLAKRTKQIGKKKYVFEDVIFTTCGIKNPHFYFHADKVWYYDKDKLVALGNTYNVAGGSLLYFPIFFRTYKGTGIQTAFAREERIGWYIMNTYWLNTKTTRYKFKLDHYERIGEYFGVDVSRGFKGKDKSLSLNANLDLSYAYKLDWDPARSRWSVLIDWDGDKIYESYRELGWRIRANLNYNDRGTGISFNYDNFNDPYITQFYSRQEAFDVMKLIKPHENRFYNRSRLGGYTRSIRVNFSKSPSSFSLSGSWKYNLVVNPDEPNPFKNDHWKAQLTSSSFPSISYSYSGGNLFKWEIGITKTTNVQIKKKVKQNGKETTQTQMTQKTYTAFRFFSIAVNYSAGMSLSSSSSYDEYGNPLSDNFNHSERAGISIPIIILEYLKINTSWNISSRRHWSRTTDTNRIRLDNLNSYTSLDYSSSFGFGGKYFEKTPYNLSWNIGFSHRLSYVIDKIDVPNDPYEKIRNHSAGVGFNFQFDGFKFSTGTGINLEMHRGEEFIWRDRISPLNLNFSYTPPINSKYVSLSMNDVHAYDIRTERSTRNSFNLGFSLKNIRITPLVDKLNSLNFSFSWFHDYLNHKACNLSMSLSLNFEINPLWKVSFSTSVRNTKLYRYVKEWAEEYNEPYVNFFEDVLRGLNFFDYEERKLSLFKVQGFRVNIWHDLHEWQMNLSFNFVQKRDMGRRLAYFEPSFLLTITMKKNVGLQFEPIEKTFVPDEVR